MFNLDYVGNILSSVNEGGRGKRLFLNVRRFITSTTSVTSTSRLSTFSVCILDYNPEKSCQASGRRKKRNVHDGEDDLYV